MQLNDNCLREKNETKVNEVRRTKYLSLIVYANGSIGEGGGARSIRHVLTSDDASSTRGVVARLRAGKDAGTAAQTEPRAGRLAPKEL